MEQCVGYLSDDESGLDTAADSFAFVWISCGAIGGFRVRKRPPSGMRMGVDATRVMGIELALFFRLFLRFFFLNFYDRGFLDVVKLGKFRFEVGVAEFLYGALVGSLAVLCID